MQVKLVTSHLSLISCALTHAHDRKKTQLGYLARLLPTEAKKSPQNIATNGESASFHNGSTLWVFHIPKQKTIKIETQMEIQSSRIAPSGAYVAVQGISPPLLPLPSPQTTNTKTT